MEFHGISRKSELFTVDAQFHGKCHGCEILNWVGAYPYFHENMLRPCFNKMDTAAYYYEVIQNHA